MRLRVSTTDADRLKQIERICHCYPVDINIAAANHLSKHKRSWGRGGRAGGDTHLPLLRTELVSDEAVARSLTRRGRTTAAGGGSTTVTHAHLPVAVSLWPPSGLPSCPAASAVPTATNSAFTNHPPRPRHVPPVIRPRFIKLLAFQGGGGGGGSRSLPLSPCSYLHPPPRLQTTTHTHIKLPQLSIVNSFTCTCHFFHM